MVFGRIKRKVWTGVIVATVAFVVLLVVLGCPLVPRTTETSGPVALAEARRGCPIPLPDSARNVRYACYSLWQGYEVYVRFEAPPGDCLAHVNPVFATWQGQHGFANGPSQLPRPLISAPERVRSSSLNVTWFDVQDIRNGVAAGEGGPMSPRIWGDVDRGVFYFAVTD